MKIQLNKIISLPVILFTILLCFEYDLTILDHIMAFVTIFLSLKFFHSVKTVEHNIFTLLLIYYLFCSIHVVAAFRLTSYGFFKNIITPGEYLRLARWGIHLFFILFLYLTIFRKKAPKISSNQITHKVLNPHFEKVAIAGTIVVFFVQFISISLGIVSNNEDAAIVLPFHLNGLLDEFRTSFYPFLFVIYIYDRLTKHYGINKTLVACYILYAFIEMFATSSKSAFTFAFIQIFVILFLIGYVNKKMVLRYLLPGVLSFVILYPIIEFARRDDSISIKSMVSAAKNTKEVDPESKSSPYIRTFLTGLYYVKMVDILRDNETEFDFRRVPQLVLLNGGSGYMTRVIDQVPEDIHHSSGITGLCDALLWGGDPLCYIILIVLAFLAQWFDKSLIMYTNPLYSHIFFFFYLSRLTNTTISLLIDGTIFVLLISIIIKVLMVRFYKNKYGM